MFPGSGVEEQLLLIWKVENYNIPSLENSGRFGE